MDEPRVIRFDIDDEVYLRTVDERDAQGVLDAVVRNCDHLRPFAQWIKPDYSIKDAREFVNGTYAGADPDALSFGIFRKRRFIGTIGFAYFDSAARVTEIGYWIDAAEEGKGIVSRACRLLLGFAFTELGMNRVQIRCATSNNRSAAIPERLGFTKEGVQRQHIIRDGKLYDFAIYGMLASEWSEPPA